MLRQWAVFWGWLIATGALDETLPAAGVLTVIVILVLPLMALTYGALEAVGLADWS